MLVGNYPRLLTALNSPKHARSTAKTIRGNAISGRMKSKTSQCAPRVLGRYTIAALISRFTKIPVQTSTLLNLLDEWQRFRHPFSLVACQTIAVKKSRVPSGKVEQPRLTEVDGKSTQPTWVWPKSSVLGRGTTLHPIFARASNFRKYQPDYLTMYIGTPDPTEIWHKNEQRSCECKRYVNY